MSFKTFLTFHVLQTKFTNEDHGQRRKFLQNNKYTVKIKCSKFCCGIKYAFANEWSNVCRSEKLHILLSQIMNIMFNMSYITIRRVNGTHIPMGHFRKSYLARQSKG